MSAHLLLLLGLAGGAVLCPRANGQRPESSPIAASVNGDTISSAQLEDAVRTQIQALEERARQLRRATLNKLIDNLLLEQAARGEGLSVSDYLYRHVESIGVLPADVDTAYERSREQFPGVLPAEAKYRIRRTLEDNRRAATLEGLLKKLRAQAMVTNRLMEDRLSALDFAAQEGPARGEAGAAVTIVEFSDFECPYCRAAQPALTEILERWPGRVRLIFKHFPLDQHAGALPAARAAVCAEQQGAFWALHDRIFAADGPVTEAVLRSAADGAGVNLAKFEACRGGEESLERVRKDILLGRSVGVAGTPAFFVNRQQVASPAELNAAVERNLGGRK